MFSNTKPTCEDVVPDRRELSPPWAAPIKPDPRGPPGANGNGRYPQSAGTGESPLGGPSHQTQQLAATLARVRNDLARRERDLDELRAREAQQLQRIGQLTADVARLTTTFASPDQPAGERVTDETSALRGQVDELYEELAQQAEALDRLKQDGGQFRAIMDQAGEAVLVVDVKTHQIVDANETACRWLHRSRDALGRCRIDDLDLEFPVEAPEAQTDHVPDTRRSSRSLLVANGRVRRRNGTAFRVEVALSKGRYQDRDVTLVVAREVNARRNLEDELRDARGAYQSLFALCRDAVYLSSRDGSIADVNDAAVELLGYPRPEFLGLRATLLYDDPREIRAFQEAIDENGFARDLPVTLVRKDGSRFPALLSATLRRTGGGNVLGYQCIARIRD